jgi:hypothetical protein
MPVTVVASSGKCNASWESFKKRVDERRSVIENARNMNLSRLNQDVQRIAKRETEFAKQVFEEIVPFKVEWDQEAWERINSVVPLRVVPNKTTPAAPENATEVVQDPSV